TYRAGSIEQLEEHAKRLGTKMIKHAYGADPAAVAYDTISHAKAHGINVVLIDTAGRMQTNQNLMNELEKNKTSRKTRPDRANRGFANRKRCRNAGRRVQQVRG